jgi:hypothetical protein
VVDVAKLKLTDALAEELQRDRGQQAGSGGSPPRLAC